MSICAHHVPARGSGRAPLGLLTAALVVVAAALCAGPAGAQSNEEDVFLYENAPLRKVLIDVRERTGVHFLYRDVLVAGKSVSFRSNDESVLERLGAALAAEGLQLQVDEARNQVLLVERSSSDARDPGRPFSIHGIVVDDAYGTRLPHATVVWNEDGRLRGVTTDGSGHFQVQLSSAGNASDGASGAGDAADGAVAAAGSSNAAGFELSVSHIGYVTQHLRIDRAAASATIPIRLVPETARGPEVIVSASALAGEVDTTWHHLLRPGLISPLGESGVMRSLQMLPSVSMSTAAAAGLNVRGSRADGFQVLLDGMSIYNQSHLFGLFDAFNAEVLQTVGLYYAIAPASLQGPPGGTLAYVTRTGSMTDIRGSVGASNTSGKGTLEGPLAGGRGSWLLSGRHSWLNALDLFDSAELIRLGLDVGRETDVPTGPVREIPVSALTTGEASADFYDAHGKLAYEWTSGARLTASGYAGGDETLHRAERLVEETEPIRDVRLIQADTRNNWFNAAASMALIEPVGARAFMRTEAGLSRYRSSYSKDDFVYSDPTRRLLPITDSTRHVVRPFSNENQLLELKLAQRVDASRKGATWSAGYALHHFEIDYREQSIFRGGVDESRESIQADVFLQADGRPLPVVGLSAGLRTHYFQHGSFLRLSPRLRVRFFPDGRLSVGAGYSRNHQFIHRLYIEQSTHADIWVLSSENQPPGSVDHLSTGATFRASPGTFVQVEAYAKRFTNLREHEASAARRSLRTTSPLLDPWLHDNEGRARGVEVMVRQHIGGVTWTNSYTWSTMELRNDRVAGGSWYAADWDRRHQVTSHAEASVTDELALGIIWVSGSGTPNALAVDDPREPERLSAYHRMDASLRWHKEVGGGRFELKANVFNVLDRDNTWYRSPIAVAQRTADGRRVGFMNVDVYDLGHRPSVEVSYSF